MIQPGKGIPKPKNGVWFGEYRSDTNQILNQTMKNEAMIKAMVNVFAFGECEALIIPNCSSFLYAAIVVKSVYFGGKQCKEGDNDEFMYLEIKREALFGLECMSNQERRERKYYEYYRKPRD